MLQINNLHVEVEGTPILKGLNLTINAGEVHSIMGLNGSGKSTLAKVLAGHEAYEVTDGEILFEGKDLLELDPDERAHAGVFLAFQHPIEIPGVNNIQFLKASVNAVRASRGEQELDALEFRDLVQGKLGGLEIDPKMLGRSVNEGFSGGERKRYEILQMTLLEPKLCVLDETDSGLDIDALKIVADGVNALRNAGRSFLVITHYQRLLNHIVPDVVHVLIDGQVVKSGGKELALELEEKGYDWLKPAAATAS